MKFSIKVRRRRFGGFIVNFEHISHLCSSVSIVNFEHVIADWVLTSKKDVLRIREILCLQIATFSGKAIIKVNVNARILNLFYMKSINIDLISPKLIFPEFIIVEFAHNPENSSQKTFIGHLHKQISRR